MIAGVVGTAADAVVAVAGDAGAVALVDFVRARRRTGLSGAGRPISPLVVVRPLPSRWGVSSMVRRSVPVTHVSNARLEEAPSRALHVRRHREGFFFFFFSPFFTLYSTGRRGAGEWVKHSSSHPSIHSFMQTNQSPNHSINPA